MPAENPERVNIETASPNLTCSKSEQEFVHVRPRDQPALHVEWQSTDREWQVTLKIDGVRAIWHDDVGWQSRANRPLYNLSPWQSGEPRDCELFVHSFRDTIIATRTRLPKSDTPSIRQEHLYGLDQLDPRLDFGTLVNPSASEILLQLNSAQALGFEGLVLRQAERWLKVKPHETHDVPIAGFVEGRGKHAGRLGIIETPLGNVGCGFSDEERVALWVEAQAGSWSVR